MIISRLVKVKVFISFCYGVIVMLMVKRIGQVIVVWKNLYIICDFFCRCGDIMLVSFNSIVRNSMFIGVGRLISLWLSIFIIYSSIVSSVLEVRVLMLVLLFMFLFLLRLWVLWLWFGISCFLLVRCGKCLLSWLRQLEMMIVVRLLSIIIGNIWFRVMFCFICISVV